MLEVPKGALRIERASDPVRLSLIIPTFNEAKNLEELVRRLSAALDPTLAGAYELIVVDDDSPDRTWSLALSLAQAYPALKVLRRQGERGLSTAVIRGWQASRGEVLAVVEADLRSPPEVVARLWAEMAQGADLAAGSRHMERGVSDWSATPRGLSRGAQLLGRAVLPGVVSRVSDPMSGLFMVRRAALEGVALKPRGGKILIEVLGRGRIEKIAEVFSERAAGESKVNSRLSVGYLAHLLRLRLATLPPRFLMYALVGFSGVFIDMGMLFLLSDVVGLGLGVSKACAVETAIVSNFLLNDVWTFGDLTVGKRGGAARLRRFIKFNAVCGVGLVLSVALLTLQVSLLGLNQYLANAIAILLVTVWNFWMNKTFSWAGARTSKPTAI